MQPIIVSKRDLAELLNLSERRITDLMTAGILPPRGASGFDVVASVQGYVKFLKSEPASLKTARARVATLQGDLLDLAYKQKAGTLVDRDAVDKAFFRCAREIRDGLANMPHRLAGVLAAGRKQEAVFRMLEKELRECVDGVSSDLSNGKTHADVRPAPPPRRKDPPPPRS